MKGKPAIWTINVFLLLLTVVKTYGQLLPANIWLPDVPLAVNEYGANDGPVPAAAKDQFSIVVDPELHPKNFISFYEHYQRTQSVKQLADSVHRANNAKSAGKQLVYFINNTNNNIYLQMQDLQFIGVVEALDNDKQWRPIQYWQPSTCGNSYLTRPVKAHSSVVFIAPAIRKGSYKTRLRYQVFGAESVLYSNEFEAAINYGDFERVATAEVNKRVFKKSAEKIEMPLTL